MLSLERIFDHPVSLISLMGENYLLTENMLVCPILGCHILPQGLPHPICLVLEVLDVPPVMVRIDHLLRGFSGVYL